MSLKLVLLLLVVAVASTHGFGKGELVGAKSSLIEDNTGLGIYDGKTTTIQKHPYIAVLQVTEEFFGVATIVSPSWVITSADTVQGVDPTDLTVLTGSSDSVKGTSYAVINMTMNPNYGKEAFDYDFACLQIKGKFTWNAKTKPIKLPNKAPKANSIMVVAGWGDTSGQVDNDPNTALMEGTMKWMPTKACKTFVNGHGATWTPRMGCAYNKGKTTLCSDDWGDAFIQNGVFYGIFIGAITQDMCTEYANPLVLGDIHSVAKWIKTTTGAKYEDE